MRGNTNFNHSRSATQAPSPLRGGAQSMNAPIKSVDRHRLYERIVRNECNRQRKVSHAPPREGTGVC